jgi:hypothetical protein
MDKDKVGIKMVNVLRKTLEDLLKTYKIMHVSNK